MEEGTDTALPAAEAVRAEALLAQAGLLLSKHEAHATASGQNFNLFRVLGQETREVRTHSAMLAELLNPKGSHGQRAVFARLFANLIGMDGAKLEDARVSTEKSIDSHSRLDIVLQTDDTCVVIENKIYAEDQDRQLERYQEYAERSKNSKVIYLTLHGDEPSKKSLGGLDVDKVTCWSYERDVIEWLDDCIKEVARIPEIREILAHYQALLRRLTGKSTGELTMEFKQLLRGRQAGTYNFELVPNLALAMTELSIETEWAFWTALKEKLEAQHGRGWQLVHHSPDHPFKEVSEGVLRHAHNPTGRKKWGYGWTFRIESETAADLFRSGGTEVLLRVECDDDSWVYCGLIAVRSTLDGFCRLDRNGAQATFEDWAQRVPESQGGWHVTDEEWLVWSHPRSGGLSLWKQAWLRPESIRSLQEDKDKTVGEFVETLRNLLEKITG